MTDRVKTGIQISVYAVLVLVVAELSPWLGGSPQNMGPVFLLWGVTPTLAALLVRLFSRDWMDAGWSLGLKAHARWYMFVLLASPGLALLTAGLGIALSALSVVDFTLPAYLQLVLPGFAVFGVFAIFEEIGWRGFLAPKLAALGINDFLAYGLTGILWAAWHLPYVSELTWIYSPEPLTTFLPRFFLSMMAFSILWGELRRITGSIWPIVLFHGLTNAVQHPLSAEFLIVAPSMQAVVGFNGWAMAALAALLGTALNRLRMHRI